MIVSHAPTGVRFDSGHHGKEARAAVGRLARGESASRGSAAVESRRWRPGELAPRKGWTFIANHAQVLLAVARNPFVRVREIAEAVDITERYAYQLLSDLQQAGYVRRSRRGRCNRYRVNPDLALGDPVVEDRSLRELLRLNGQSDSPDEAVVAAPRRRSA